MRRGAVLTMLVACGILTTLQTGCQDPLGPTFGEPVALVQFGGQSDVPAAMPLAQRFAAIGLDTRTLRGWSDPITLRFNSSAPSAGAPVYVVGSDEGHNSIVATLDPATMGLSWSARTDTLPPPLDRGFFFNGEPVAGPDGRRVFAILSRDYDVGYHIAAVDPPDVDSVPLLGPYSGLPSMALIPRGAIPTGALAVSAGERWFATGSEVWLFDPKTLAVLDTVDLSPGLAHSEDGIAFFTPSPDGSRLYARFAGGALIAYDLAADRITAVVYPQAPVCGECMAAAPDGTLYLAHQRVRDGPAPGHILVYGPDLEPAGSIDVSHRRAATDDGRHPSLTPSLTTLTVVSDTLLLVATGNTWTPERPSVLYIHRESHEVIGEVVFSEPFTIAWSMHVVR